MLNSALCEGNVSHIRFQPTRHHFRYKLNSLWLDLDEIAELDALPFWSSQHRALVRFHRDDYLDPQQRDLKCAVYNRLREQDIEPQPGRVVMLGQLRSWGLCFNPVTFYFCFDLKQHLYAIVAQITNTPWRERHVYALPVANVTEPGQRMTFQFDKDFHVSPFMPMDMHYCWHFHISAHQIDIRMELTRENERQFNAHMRLGKKPLTSATARHQALFSPAQSARILGSIYWQALQLWLKRTPVHTHTNRHNNRENQDAS